MPTSVEIAVGPAAVAAPTASTLAVKTEEALEIVGCVWHRRWWKTILSPTQHVVDVSPETTCVTTTVTQPIGFSSSQPSCYGGVDSLIYRAEQKQKNNEKKLSGRADHSCPARAKRTLFFSTRTYRKRHEGVTVVKKRTIKTFQCVSL